MTYGVSAPMTLTWWPGYEFDLHIFQTYTDYGTIPKNEVTRWRFSKVKSTNRQTDRQTDANECIIGRIRGW